MMEWEDIVETEGFTRQTPHTFLESLEFNHEKWIDYRNIWRELQGPKKEAKRAEDHRKFVLNRIEKLKSDIDNPGYLVPRYLEDDTEMFFHFISTLDRKTKRKREIKKIAALSVWDEALPDPEDLYQIEDSERREKMNQLYDSFAKIWQDAIYSYIDGHYFASVVSMSSLLEAVLNFKMEVLGLESRGKSLSNSIGALKQEEYFKDVSYESQKLKDKLTEIKNIRNDVVHLNIEQGVGGSKLAKKDGAHESQEYNEDYYLPSEVILRIGDSISIKEGDYYNPSKFEVTYLYRGAAKEVIKLTYECLEVINSRKSVFE